MTQRILQTGFGLLILAFLATANAQVEGGMPVALGTGCHFQVMVPDDSMGYIPSADCKTVYMLPSADANLKVAAFSPNMNSLLCSGLQSYMDGQNEIRQNLNALGRQLNAAKNDKDKKFIQSKIDALRSYIGLGSDMYADKEAGIAQLIFKSVTDQSAINNWAVNNLELIRSQGVQFTAAPVTTSVLTFSSTATIDKSSSALLSTAIPGLNPLSDGSYKSVAFNGALSGQVVFSLYGLCPILSKTPETMDDLRVLAVDPVKASAYLVANRSFEVPTRTKMSYKATLNQAQAIHYMQVYQQSKSTFSVSEFINKQSDADLENIVRLDAETSVMTIDQKADWELMKRDLHTEVANRLVGELAAAMVKLNILAIDPETPAPAPAAGTTSEARSRRACSSHSFFGIKVGSSCHDEVYYVAVPREGKSSLDDTQNVNFNISLTESMTINDIYPYSFTQTFEVKK